jgi:uncharacterized protein YggU (UPF0235/DUF167 family)
MATLAVKVVPGASRTRLAGTYGDGVKMQVAAAPEKGQANAAVVRLLADLLEVPAADIVLLTGHSRPRKLLRIEGLDEAEIRRRLAVHMPAVTRMKKRRKNG